MSSNEDRWFFGGDNSGADISQEILRRDSLLVGDTCRLQGKLEFSGRGQFDGVIDGEIVSHGELTVGPHAQVNARITGATVIVRGRVNGNIVCSERLELRTGAHVVGDVVAPRLVVDDGVIFEGFCQMTPKTEPEKPETEAVQT